MRSLQSIFQKSLYQNLLFVLVFGAVAWFYNYQEILTYRPTSMHQWRNCVSASMALNYAHEGDFFHPRTHNLQADEMQSDISVTEFPVFYYLIGMLYRVFGFHEIIYRLMHLLIGFAGLFFLYRTGIRMFGHVAYALTLPLLVFSSPIYVYYLNNFIPDAPSLSIVLIAFYFFYRFYGKGKGADLAIAMLFFALAGLIKPPAFLLYFAILGVLILEWIFGARMRSDRKIFQYPIKQLVMMLGPLILALGWFTYARIYTDTHGGIVSEVELRPIWILSRETIQNTWASIVLKFQNGQYHSPAFLLLSGLLFIFVLIRWKKQNQMMRWLVILTFLGGVSFSLLFYRSLRNHDYYQMNNLVIPVLVFVTSLLYMKDQHQRIFRSWISHLVILVFVLFTIISCQSLLHSHYYGGWHEWNARERYNKPYNDITPYLRSLGINRDDKVYCTPDPSINISLYLMDQKGFTDFFRKNQAFSEKVELFAGHGLQYVIIGKDADPDVNPGDAGLIWIGEHKGAKIYRLE